LRFQANAVANSLPERAILLNLCTYEIYVNSLLS
jgi:hypothetical protein